MLVSTSNDVGISLNAITQFPFYFTKQMLPFFEQCNNREPMVSLFLCENTLIPEMKIKLGSSQALVNISESPNSLSCGTNQILLFSVGILFGRNFIHDSEI